MLMVLHDVSNLDLCLELDPPNPHTIKKNHGVLIKNAVKNYLLHGENKYILALDIEVSMSANDRVEVTLFGGDLCLYKGKEAYRKMKHPYNPFYAICWSFYDLCIHSLDYCSSKLLEKFYKEVSLSSAFGALHHWAPAAQTVIVR